MRTSTNMHEIVLLALPIHRKSTISVKLPIKICALTFLVFLIVVDVKGQCTYNYLESKTGSATTNKVGFPELCNGSTPLKYYLKTTFNTDVKYTFDLDISHRYAIHQMSYDEIRDRFSSTVYNTNFSGYSINKYFVYGDNQYNDYELHVGTVTNSKTGEWNDYGATAEGIRYLFSFDNGQETICEKTYQKRENPPKNSYATGMWSNSVRLSDECSTSRIESEIDTAVEKNMSQWKLVCKKSCITGSATLEADEKQASKTKTLFRFKIPLSDKDTRYTFSWPVYTTITYNGSSKTTTNVHIFLVDGNGGEVTTPEQTDLVVNFKGNGYTVTKTIDADKILMSESSINGSDGGCGSCGGGGGGSVARGGGLLSLGYNTNGLPVGNLSIDQNSFAPATPGLLQLFAMSEDVVNIVSNGSLRQVMSSQMLVDIISNTPCQFDINVYDVNHFNTTPVGGLYPVITGGQFLTWRIENPGGADDTNNLRMIEIRDGHAVTNLITKSPDEINHVLGNGLKTIKEKQFWNNNNTERTVVSKTYDASNKLVYSVTNVFSVGTTYDRLISTTEGVAADSRTTTYDGNGTTYYPDGTWSKSTYDTEGYLIKTSSENHGTTYGYSLLTGEDTNSIFAQGIPRSITNYFGNEGNNIVGISYRLLTPTQRVEIQATSPNAQWNDPRNLFTTNNYDVDGRLTSTIYPDQTIRWYSYNIGSVGRTNIISTGYWNGGAYVTNQVTTTVRGLNGRILSTTSIESGLLTASTLYTNYDTLGRVGQVKNLLDGTSVFYQYDCCGIASSTDRNGVVTINTYNDLKQLDSKTEIGASSITWYYNYDPVGHLLSSKRQGGTLSSATFDTAGHQSTAINALLGVTTYSENAASLTRTTTNPDGGTRIETYNLDGTIRSLTGTAAHPVSYSYGAYDGGTWVLENKENSYEPVKTYTDMVGHNWKTEYYNNVVSSNCYNNQGQIWKKVDPDGVTTLYTYNAKGDQEYTIVALRDDTRNLSNYADLLSSLSEIKGGVDRITQTISEVVTNHATTVRRLRTYIWLDNQSTGTLASVSETSVDGLKSWQVNYGEANEGKPTTNTSVTTISGSIRTTTNTAPDGSKTVSVYSYGLLTSSIRYDANSVPIGGSSYTYDDYGRTYQMTDARNGTTTYGYNDADQVNTATTPVPGGGQSALVTTTLYDSMLRPYSIIQPDGSSVNNVYLLTGELVQQTGSRIYPVGYSYDYAGRMLSMTNWSDYPGKTGARVTTWDYDYQRGWLNKKTYPNSENGKLGNYGPSYSYTSAGRLKTRNWVRLGENNISIITSNAYDSAGSITNVSYSDGATPNVSYTYDRLGRQKTATWNGITDTITYNLAGQLLSETFTGGSLAGLSITNGYDQFLRRTNLTALGAGVLNRTDYGYDAASRLQSVSDGSNSASYAYLANSPLVSKIAFKQGNTPRMTTIKQFDYLNRLRQIASAPRVSGALPFSYNYNYNSANQRTKNTLADGSYWIYEYDTLGQVTNGVKHFADGTPVPGQQFCYLFDDIGNRIKTQSGGDQSGASLRPANYTVNSLNQITSREFPGTNDIIGAALAGNSVSVNGNTNVFRRGEYFWTTVEATNKDSAQWLNVTVASGGKTNAGNLYLPQTPEDFVYDADGNLVSDGRWKYVWDAENRLVQMTNHTSVGPQFQLDFAYDPKGRRIQKTVSTNGVGIYTNRFLYDGWNLIAELKPGNSLVRSYMWGMDLSGSEQGAGGVGGLLAASYYGTTTTNCFPAFDGNGNVMAYINAADGASVLQMDYDPFLNVIRETGPMASLMPFLGSTKYYDRETKLLYYGHRYLKDGVWPSRDPIGESGFEVLRNGKVNVASAGVNLYLFVNNNPLSQIDRLGLSCSCGPDITQTLTRTLVNVERQWELSDPATQKTTCEHLNTPSGWDAGALISANFSSPCGASGSCSHTVTVNGVCYLGSEVNYVLYGKMCALCNMSQPYMDAAISYWKLWKKLGPYDHQLRGALAWANAGYVGWPNSKMPYSDKTSCSPCSYALPDLMFKWHAGAIAWDKP